MQDIKFMKSKYVLNISLITLVFSSLSLYSPFAFANKHLVHAVELRDFNAVKKVLKPEFKDRMKALFQEKLDVNYESSQPLTTAIFNGDFAIADLLLEQKAEVNARVLQSVA